MTESITQKPDSLETMPGGASPRLPLLRNRYAVGVAAAAVLVLAAGGVGVGMLVFSPEDSGSILRGELTYAVSRGPLVISFSEQGEVKAARSVPVFCELEGRSTILTIVSEGSYVKQGDLLVELDASELEEALNQQLIAVETSESTLKQAQEQVIIQESLNQSSIDSAVLELELAEIDLEMYEKGNFPLSRDKAQQDIFIAQEELARARNKYEWTQKLAEKGYVNRMDLQADKLAVDKADVSYKQATGGYDLLVKYTHEKQVKVYKDAVRQAGAALERARRKAGAEMSKAKADEKAAQSKYDLTVQRLEKIRDQLKKTRVLAPQDGMVVYETSRSRFRGDRMIEAGAEVYENQLLMKLPDVATMSVEVKVHESWIDQIEEGQPAAISVEALPNASFTGRVVRVGLLPDYVNRWLNPDLKVYETEVNIEPNESTALLRPGMSAQVQILVSRLRDVMSVPVQSVTTVEREQACYVWTGGGFEPRIVTCGRYNDTHIEVIGGLEVGEIVQLTAPPPVGESDMDQLKDLEEFQPGMSDFLPGAEAVPAGMREREGGGRGPTPAAARSGGERRPGGGGPRGGGGRGMRPRGDGERRGPPSGRARGEGARPAQGGAERRDGDGAAAVGSTQGEAEASSEGRTGGGQQPPDAKGQGTEGTETSGTSS